MRGLTRATLLLLVLTVSVPAAPVKTDLRLLWPGRPQEAVAFVPYYHLPQLPEPDFGWGFYFDYNRIPEHLRTDAYVRKCMRQMAKAGFNTVTLYGDKSTITRHAHIAYEESLIGTQPVLCLGDLPDAVVQDPPIKWPEFVGYGPDEPGPEQSEAVRESVAAWHTRGVRCATAVKYAAGISYVQPLDIWILNARNLYDGVIREGKDLWLYECRFRGTNQRLHRYWTGIYAYAMHARFGVKALWTWGYLHDADSELVIGSEGTWRWHNSGRYEHALPGPDGPIGTVGLDGMAEGIEDFKVLHALEETGDAKKWLEHLTLSVKPEFWKGTTVWDNPLSKPDMWDDHDTAQPLVDVEEIMQTAVHLLLDAKAGY
jgi:hypothetical protein